MPQPSSAREEGNTLSGIMWPGEAMSGIFVKMLRIKNRKE